MSFFMPFDCSIDLATPYWLLAALALLSVAALALVIQAILIWRRGGRAGVAWWRRLPLALPLLWAVVCVLYATQTYSFYRVVTTPFDCGRVGIRSLKGLCMSTAQFGDITKAALVVAALILGVGWLALARLNRRI